jgi:hypothetical protein
MTDKVLHRPRFPEAFANDLPEIDGGLSRRINADPDRVERGLAQLVLTIVELLRQLMERQALRRIDGGGLTDEQVERLGRTFMELDRRMEQLREEFGLEAEDLNLDLGPLGRLM